MKEHKEQLPENLSIDQVLDFIDWLNNNWFIPSDDGFWELDTGNLEFERTIPGEETFFDSEDLVRMFLNGDGQ